MSKKLKRCTEPEEESLKSELEKLSDEPSKPAAKKAIKKNKSTNKKISSAPELNMVKAQNKLIDFVKNDELYVNNDESDPAKKQVD